MAVRGLLLDIQGVLYDQNGVLPGAREATDALAAQGVTIRCLTNTTTAPRLAVAESLSSLGLAVDPAHILSPAAAAVGEMQRAGHRRVHLAADPALAQDLHGFLLVDARPDAVVLGDLGPGFTYERLDDIFRLLIGEGGHPPARLIALHKNRYSRGAKGLCLDLGPFVVALEYAAGIEALVVGKPAAAFFAEGLRLLGCRPEEAVMVGDDLDADIAGAQAAGIRAVQVETGKFRPEDRTRQDVRPDARIPSIAGLPDLLRQWAAGG